MSIKCYDDYFLEGQVVVCVKDVLADKFISSFAQHLKRQGRFEMPKWADVVKTGKAKELPPLDPDWLYVRTASMVRKLYIRGGTGVGGFRKVYGCQLKLVAVLAQARCCRPHPFHCPCIAPCSRVMSIAVYDAYFQEGGTTTTVKDVLAETFIAAFSQHLKRQGRFEIPKWGDVVKTGKAKELPPSDPDWLYVRTASMVRKLYIRGGTGVGG
eukprot:CAMPEP_0197945428 /NCGR_PEP_ID=MMETSP1439-20131203/125905_1 /TAXON_ID=66791 /ORGANISM="Gonyaulax spinifera, Strain CCMP409" /LENGTH=211 /DNA_ID=CAMNT_0043568683 /DNA_START=84 /DNA_END=716 /DNA_ORIENTATION=+